MATLRFRSVQPTLPVDLISRLRQITKLPIAEIRSRAANNEVLFEITSFQNDWKERRQLLARIAADITSGSLPLSVTELFSVTESPVSTQMLGNLIQRFRQIELETQMHTQLELGEISDPSEFQPFDSDWTR